MSKLQHAGLISEQSLGVARLGKEEARPTQKELLGYFFPIHWESCAYETSCMFSMAAGRHPQKSKLKTQTKNATFPARTAKRREPWGFTKFMY